MDNINQLYLPTCTEMRVDVELHECRTPNMKIGTVGRIFKVDERFIWLKFAKPIEDIDNATWLWDEEDGYDRYWLGIGYKPDELSIMPTSHEWKTTWCRFWHFLDSYYTFKYFEGAKLAEKGDSLWDLEARNTERYYYDNVPITVKYGLPEQHTAYNETYVFIDGTANYLIIKDNPQVVKW